MRRLVITEEEKKSILSKHVSKGYKSLMEQEEIIVTDHDKNWDYKKVGDEYFTKKKTSDKWIKPTGSALEAIKSKVKFPDKPTEQPKQEQPKQETKPEQPKQETKPEQPKQETKPEQPKQETKPEDTKKGTLIDCDTIIDGIAYGGIDGDKKSDTSLLNRKKWFEYFGDNIENTKNNGVITALRQLKKDSSNGVMKKYVFRDLKIPINITSKYYSLKEDSCCILIKRGVIANFDLNKSDKQNEDSEAEVLNNNDVTIFIKGGDNIKKVDCGE